MLHEAIAFAAMQKAFDVFEKNVNRRVRNAPSFAYLLFQFSY
ncbi:hypothetical protein B4099_1944 [Heyndrickxia coagulans]|uniref:Uncharacterized protein n=1 Tax=Heyndrickxia coagulans TaxID=1398 RepID=A0A150JYB6_HEYCO|nr:hypothetical protein B4099_1944 [Heyndrickxia coagulans]